MRHAKKDAYARYGVSELIEHISNRRFVNRPSLGSYVDTEFDTYMELAGGKEDILHVNARLHYFERGTGRPVILLHGALQNLYTFRNNIGDLSAGRRVIAMDLPGHGFSDCPDITYSVDDMSIAVGAFMDALEIESADFVAFGQAAAYAAHFACYNKERAGSLILIHPGPMLSTALPGAKSIAGSFGGSIGKYTKFSFMQRALEDAYFDRTLLTAHIVEEYCANFADPEHRQAMRLAVVNFDDDETLSKLEMLDKPVLLISANDDTVSNREDVDAYKEVLQNGFSVDIRNCGYFPQEEKPDKVDKAIVEFLEKYEV